MEYNGKKIIWIIVHQITNPSKKNCETMTKSHMGTRVHIAWF